MAHPKLQWTHVDSSNVDSVAYDEETHTLAVQFKNGGLYSYSDVELDIYTDLVHAESVGQYFARMVRNRYDYLKWFNETDLLNHLSRGQ